jgi:hypothetical protein
MVASGGPTNRSRSGRSKSKLAVDKKLKSILKQEKLEHLLPIFTDQGVTDSILSDFSADDLHS